MTAIDGAMLLLRIVVGLSFFAHGVRHARTLDGTARWFERVGFKMAPWQARLSAFSELAAGAGLVVGLFAPIAAAAVVATMVTAAGAVHRFNGFFTFNKGEGWEYVNVLGTAAFVIAWLGPGSISLDHLVSIDWGRTAGFLIGVGGIVAGIVQLLLFWRQPVSS
ncbi:MAG TPA: DoxX family protein [Acidimicrobiia bacterium]|nr:DoxX family protein [Acidimicrobiia bacterium]